MLSFRTILWHFIAGKRSLLLSLIFLFPLTGYAQPLITEQGPGGRKDTIYLHGFLDRDTTLTPDHVYVIEHNVRVNQDVTLTILPGTRVLFRDKTAIVVEGGLNIQGKPNNFVHFTSLHPDQPGLGILIRGTEGKNVEIAYTRFYKILTPIELEAGWFRDTVNIHDNIFRDIATGEPIVVISSPDYIRVFEDRPPGKLNFSRNSFFNNWGSIFVESFEDDRVQIQLDNNLLTNNVVYGIDKGVPSNTPLFGVYDGEGRRFKTIITENSIFGNYQINSATDSIIREISIGIQGEGDEFKIPNNFFRSTDVGYVSSTFDHFYTNTSLPLLDPRPLLSKPTQVAHAHIWKVLWDDNEIKDYTKIPKVQGNKLAMDVVFNRPVRAIGPKQLEYVYFDTVNNTINVRPVAIWDTSWAANRKTFYFTVKNPSFLENPLGYLVLSNFIDDEGFEVPEFTIGQLTAINNYSRLYHKGKARAHIPSIDVIRDRSKVQLSEEALKTLEESISTTITEMVDFTKGIGEYTSLAKTFEIGVFGGLSNYLGDITFNMVDEEHWHFAGGINGQYNINEWVSARLEYRYGRISGSDHTDPDPGRHRRLLSFRSDIHEINAVLEWHVLRYGLDRRLRFLPNVYAGIAYFHFNPKARPLIGKNPVTEEWEWADKWYELQPIGTAGQTVEGSGLEPYRLNEYAIPFGVNFDFDLGKTLMIGFDLGFRWTFTDYLDDVGGYYYMGPGGWKEDFIAIVEANPDMKDDITHTYEGDVYTAALLADPSLAFDNPELDTRDRPIHENYPFQNNGRRGDPEDNDWYMFVGVTFNKVLGLQRAKQKQQEKMEKKVARAATTTTTTRRSKKVMEGDQVLEETYEESTTTETGKKKKEKKPKEKKDKENMTEPVSPEE